MSKCIIVPGKGKVRQSNVFACVNDNKKKGASPYERTKAQVYATGNKWQIENFNATHN